MRAIQGGKCKIGPTVIAGTQWGAGRRLEAVLFGPMKQGLRYFGIAQLVTVSLNGRSTVHEKGQGLQFLGFFELVFGMNDDALAVGQTPSSFFASA